MNKKRKHTKRAAKVTCEATKSRREIHPASRRDEVRLTLPAGEPDLATLRSVTREWLVPRLVDKFLRQAGIERRAGHTTDASSIRAKAYSQIPSTYPITRKAN